VAALGRRGLHRTALETAKLLLSLDDDDPAGALQVLDYYALRSGQYDFLHRFAREYQGGAASAALLPNFAFSLALARWFQEQAADGGGGGGRRKSGLLDSRAQGGGGSASGGGDGASSSSSAQLPSSLALLARAIALHPLVVVKLQARLAGRGVGASGGWAAALAAPPLAGASDGGSAGLGHLAELFVERHHPLWKAAPVQEWLLEGVRAAAAAAGSGPGAAPQPLPGGVSAADLARARELAFPPSTANPYRHLRPHEFSDEALRLPPEEVHGGGGGGGGGGRGGEAGAAELEAELAALQAQVAQAGECGLRIRCCARVAVHVFRHARFLL
jgi:hypothetical protein